MRLAYDILCVFSFREHAMYHIYLHTLTLYEVFAYFFIYSFLGWVCDVAFHAIKTGKFVNRGFLNGPVCPIYGAGVVVILLILGDYAQQMWAVFLVGVAVPTLLELVTGWLLETFFHDKWWDYSERRFNFKGYICLEFSLLWGIAAVCVISILHPLIRKFAMLFTEIAGTVLVCIGAAILLADVILTVLQVLKLNQKLAEIDKLAKAMRAGSELIGKEVAAVTLAARKGVEQVKDSAQKKTSQVRETLEEKKEAWDEKSAARKAEAKARIDEIVKKMPKRLLKAFPSLSSRRNPDSVPLVRESMEKGKDGTSRAAATERSAQQENKRNTPKDDTSGEE